MNTMPQLAAIEKFLNSDCLYEEIQQMPDDLQEIFDMLLDTDYGNCIHTRRKMLNLKLIITQFASACKI